MPTHNYTSFTKFQSEGTEQKARDIEHAIIGVLITQCQCDLLADRITGGVFKCFPQSSQAVTYRAFIHGSINLTAFDLIVLLERWLVMDPTIVIQRVLMAVDKACTVAISSLADEECLPLNNSTLPPIQQGSLATIIGTISGTVVAGGALVLLTGISILAIVHIAKKQRNR